METVPSVLIYSYLVESKGISALNALISERPVPTKSIVNVSPDLISDLLGTRIISPWSSNPSEGFTPPSNLLET